MRRPERTFTLCSWTEASPDDTYTGSLGDLLVAATVEVTVENGPTAELPVVEPDAGAGYEALATTERIEDAQAPGVEAVSGATSGSHSTMVATYRALTSRERQLPAMSAPVGEHRDMNERNRNWYEAIELRHSRRKYVSTPVEPEKLETLAALIEELNRSSDVWRIALVRSHDGAIFSGIRGGYGIIQGAPSYLAFIGAPEESVRHEELGYIGEAAVLEATHLGLGTCWVSGTFDPAAAAKDLVLASRERLLAVSPLGYPRGSYSFTEKVMKRAARSHTRTPLEELCTGEALGEWPEWARTAAEAAQRAPSALNRQPWQFRFDGGELSVEVPAAAGGSSRGSASKRLDCGIALRHLEVGAQHSLGAPVALSFHDGRGIAGMRPVGG